VLVYDEEKAIQALMDANSWDRETAVEWFEHNTKGNYVGPGTPMFFTPPTITTKKKNRNWRQPSNGATILVASDTPITWNPGIGTGVTDVKIEYASDASTGPTWVEIASGVVKPNTGSYTWTVPTTLADLQNDNRLRISQKAPLNATVLNNGAGLFSIRPSLEVTVPGTGSESWDVGTSQTIKFKKIGAVQAVDLYYAYDGTTYSKITATPVDVSGAPDGNGEYSFSWNILAGTTLTSGFAGKIKAKVVTPSTQTIVEDVQSNAIEVKGSVTLTAPGGSGDPTPATQQVNNTYSIQWDKVGNINNVELHYSINGGIAGGGGYTSCLPAASCLIASVPSSPTNYNWTIPDTIAANVRVRVRDANNYNVWDESDVAFAIRGSATITAPTGSSVWIAGDQHTIRWDRIGTIGNVDLSYSVNGGSYTSIATGVASSSPTDNTYPWTLPTTSIVSNNVKVKIDGTNLVAPIITPSFTVKGKLTLTYPTATNVEVTLGDTLTATWNVAGDIGPVKVEFTSDGASWYTVTSTAPQNGPYGFVLDTPVTTLATAGAKVRISDADDASVTSESDNPFLVKPLLAVTRPAGGESWIVGVNENILWDYKGSNVAQVKIDYYKDGVLRGSVVNPTANDGNHAWLIPDDIQPTPNLKIHVSSLPTNDPWAVTAISNGLFQIIASLNMVTPGDATGIKWRVGSTGNQILWNAIGSVANVKLEYSVNGDGGPWNLITASTPSGSGTNLSYPWDIPAATPIVKDLARIRISDAGNPNVYDVAQADSSFLANFTFTAPVSGNVWVAQSSNSIQWTTPQAGVPATVKLEYDLGSGAGWQLLPESFATPNDGIVTNGGSQPWLLGTELSTAARLRISDPNDADSIIVSDPFKIRGNLDLTAPNGGQQWEVGQVYAITWTKLGNVTAAKLQLTTDADAGPPVYVALVDGDSQDTQNISLAGAGPYTFNWKVPDIPGITTTKAKIRVVDANDATVYDTSTVNFTIKGRVDLIQPNGGSSYTVGQGVTISGTVFGPITSVTARFSNDDGATYTGIPTGCGVSGEVTVAGDKTYTCTWLMPDELGKSLRVKAYDTNNVNVFDTSDAAFFVKGAAAITAPASGNIWIAGDQHTISWDRTGTIGNVDLSYSVNDGAYVSIASGVPSPNPTGNTYPWTLPTTGIVSANVKVKVDGANLLVPAISPVFTVKGKLTLGYPDAAGLSFSLGDTLNVTWTTAGDIGNVKVEYTDDGTTWATLTSTAAQNGPYGFTMDATTVGFPEAATASAKIRVSDADDSSVSDTSANAFMVKPVLQITRPIGGEAWLATASESVTWNQKGTNIGTVKIEYSTDSGSTYLTILETEGTVNDGVVTNDGSFLWTVPDAVQNVPKTIVRLSSMPTSDPWAVTSSSGLFKIQGALTLTSPQAVDKWPVGATRDIKWGWTGTIPSIRLAYSTDGTNYNTIVDGIAGNSGATGYPWTIPSVAGIVSNTVTVRIQDSADSTVANVSPQFKIVPTFTITAPTLNQRVITKPNATADADKFNITWTSLGQNATVNLYYSLDAFGSPGVSIAAGAPNTGSYKWVVPDLAGLATGPVTTHLRVTYPADETIFDDSDAFAIVAGFKVLSPNSASDKWDVGSSQTISWKSTSANVATVKIEYSTDGGATYPFEIDAAADNSGAADATRTYTWDPVLNTISAQFRVRVSAVNDAQALDASDTNAKIKAFFELLTPSAAGIVLKVDDPYAITWNWDGTVPNVQLHYSKDNFATAGVTILASTTNDGSEPWTVPDDISDTVRIRVRSTTDTDAFDISDNDFAIQAAFEVLEPNGGEFFQIGFPHDIRWTTTGNTTSVKLLAYSTLPGDTGFPYTLASPYVIEAALANTANGTTTYSWNPVPDLASANVKVRVEDASDATSFDESDATFRIQGAFTINTPAGGETWTVGSTQTLAWTPTGSSITEAKISYSKVSNTGPWTVVQETEGTTANDGIVTNDGSFGWVIPDALSPTVWLKIEDPNDNTVYSVSNSFRIRGGLTFVTPAGGERWVVNESRLVSWNTVGAVSAVNLVYSTDNFTSSTSVASGLANVQGLNTYAWTIPNTLSANAKLRLIDASDTPVTSDSNAFTIDLYQVTFEARDLLSNAHIDTLTVAATNLSNGTYAWNASAITSPHTQGLQFGSWAATWTHTDYGDQSVGFVADQDQTVTILMETKVVHIYEAKTEVAYDPIGDTLSLGTTLRRDGIIVNGVNFCEIKIYDPSSATPNTPIKTFTNNGAPDPQGFYNFSWNPTALVTGKVYNMRTQINLGTTGAIFITPSTFSVTTEKTLKDVKDTVDKQLDVPLSQVKDDIQTVLDDFQADIQAPITDLQDAASDTAAAADTLISAADESRSAANSLVDASLTQAAKLLVPGEATAGLPLIIRWRGPEDSLPLSAPKLTIENADGKKLVDAASMTAVSGATNTYEYVIPVVDARIHTPGRTLVVSAKTEFASNTPGSPNIQNVAVETVFVKRPDGRLLMRADVKAGEEVKIQLVGAENWTPLIQLTSRGVSLTASTPMRKVSTDGKVTTFDYTVPDGIEDVVPIGQPITALVIEPLTGFFDQGTFSLTGTSLDDIAGQVAAGSGTRSLVQDTLDLAEQILSSMGDDGQMAERLELLKSKIERIPRAIAEEAGSKQMRQAIDQVADRINTLAGEDGYDFSELMQMGVEQGLEKSETIQGIRQKTDAVQGTTEVMQILMENKLGGIDDPVVHVIFQ